MSDQESRFVIAFDGKSGTINNVLAAIKGQVRSAVSEIESTTSKIDAFKGLETSVQALGKQFQSAQDRAAEFRRQIAQIQGVGGDVGADLVKALRQTEAEITRTAKAYGRQADQLAALKTTLTAAGVDVSKLAAEELRLADALKKATAAAQQQSAKDILGFKTISDIAPKIREAQAAFNTLRSSGKLTQAELTQAQIQLNAKIAELRSQVTGAGEAARAGGPTLAAMFSGAVLPALGLTTALGTISAGIAASVAAARDYANEQARLATVTNLTRDQIAEYGNAVRQLARDLGVDLVEAQRTFFDLVREGIGEPQALIALRVSAEAAKASFTDLNVVAKVGADLMSAYGIKAEQLRSVFDQIITAAKNDGPTFEQLAPSIGSLAIAADQAAVPLDELIALLNVMASASGDGAGAVTALQKILVAWNTEGVRSRLRELNIEATDFTGTMRELAARGIPVGQLVDLGIAGSRSAIGVAALTRSTGDLDAALERTKTAAGATADAIAKLYNSPAARSARFNAELKELQVNVGEAFGTGSYLAERFADRMRQLNRSADQIREVSRVSRDANTSFLDVLRALFQVSEDAKGTATGMTALGDATASAADKARQADAQIKQLSQSFTGVSADIVAGIQALQTGSTKSIAEVQQLADAHIAALDRSAGAIAATATRTLEIQNQAAALKLAIITANEAAVSEALDKAIAARTAALRAANKTEQQIALDTARLRLAALEPVLAQYVSHYDKLVAQAQAYRAKVDAIDQGRITFNEGLEKTLFSIRLSGLSVFDQYAAKVKETERLIALAREEGAKGNIAAAERYTQEAIALSQTLGKTVTEDGRVVVGQFEAQAKQIDLIKRAGEGLNAVYAAQGDAAKEGAQKTQAQIDTVLPKLNAMQAVVDELNRKVAEGVALKLTADEASFAATEARIAELTLDRTVVITVKTVQEGAPAPGGGFAHGGMVGRLVRNFAGGGHVFRRPSWTKVPGSGDGDTVPAALQAGSFVVRKSASRYYGDGLMGRLVQGFADGGIAARLLGGKASELLQRILSRKGGSFILADGLSGSGGGVSAEYTQTLAKLRTLQEQARGLPPSSNGMSMTDWAGFLVQYFTMLSDAKKAKVKAVIEESYDGMLAGIANARKFGVPLTIDFSLAALASLAYAGGGAGPTGPDTVPAMLTPGEFVVRPQAVRRYGSSLLHAINSMAISRGALANMMAPPQVRRFAFGGEVGFGLPERGMAAPGGGTTIHVSVDGSDLLSEDAIRRRVIPVLDKIARRTR
jgi:TP901 family phage tail tape measure protein